MLADRHAEGGRGTSRSRLYAASTDASTDGLKDASRCGYCSAMIDDPIRVQVALQGAARGSRWHRSTRVHKSRALCQQLTSVRFRKSAIGEAVRCVSGLSLVYCDLQHSTCTPL